MTPKKKGPIQGSSTDIRAYNPLDLRVLAENMARVVLEQPVHPLGDVPSFKGAGVYIIYYTGDHHLYTAIAAKNRGGKWDQPIYIGEAARKGARKGGVLAEGPPDQLFGAVSRITRSQFATYGISRLRTSGANIWPSRISLFLFANPC